MDECPTSHTCIDQSLGVMVNFFLSQIQSFGSLPDAKLCFWVCKRSFACWTIVVIPWFPR